ncbi:ArgK protein [Fragilaria crotonensis]|nr:ArgK protein [Fragilaria crotonensis]
MLVRRNIFGPTGERISGLICCLSTSSTLPSPLQSQSPPLPNRERMSDSTHQLALGFASDSPQQQRFALSKAITLIESKLPRHQQEANLLLHDLLHPLNKSPPTTFRLGIAGPPGAGKSTMIESFGMYLLDKRLVGKLAVVCIDPASTVTGGSILGDKTRMMGLSRHSNAFVRPSSNGGTFGGLAAYTDDVVSLCRAANYDFVIVETVGLGQSEVEIAKSVDMMILVLPPASGDELQGVKKGIMEVADMIVVNKADGALLQAARRTAADYKAATTFMRAGHDDDWSKPPVLVVSSQTRVGLDEMWNKIDKFRTIMTANGHLTQKRKEQAHYWMWKNLRKLIEDRTKNNVDLKECALEMEQKLDNGQITPRAAAIHLMDGLLRSSDR